MKLTKKQISELKQALKEAEKAESKLNTATSFISALMLEITGIEGHCDLLSGDGFGFTPASDGDTHIAIETIISEAEKGTEITEAFILDNLSF